MVSLERALRTLRAHTSHKHIGWCGEDCSKPSNGISLTLDRYIQTPQEQCAQIRSLLSAIHRKALGLGNGRVIAATLERDGLAAEYASRVGREVREGKGSGGT